VVQADTGEAEKDMSRSRRREESRGKKDCTKKTPEEWTKEKGGEWSKEWARAARKGRKGKHLGLCANQFDF